MSKSCYLVASILLVILFATLGMLATRISQPALKFIYFMLLAFAGGTIGRRLSQKYQNN